MLPLQTSSSHRHSGTGVVVVTATCATSPLSQITSNTKITECQGSLPTYEGVSENAIVTDS